jgi:hypothetical protein
MCVVPGGLPVFLATFGLDAKFKKLATFSVQEFDEYVSHPILLLETDAWL